MKKHIALLLAVLLLVGLTACGNDANPKEERPSTTVTTKPTVVAPTGSAVAPSDTDAPTDATTATEGSGTVQATGSATQPTNSTSGTTSTTMTLPTGATVPIGTKPTTTTTATPTTGTTQSPSVGGSTAETTITTTTTTTTTSTTVKPTEPPVQGPYIVLPAVGTDIDVTKQRDRIRVSGVAAWFNEDGTIGVQLTVKNYSSNWITEETDYVEYTCYDKDGNVLQKNVRISLGCIDTKKNKEKSFFFDVPADTAEVKLTRSKITYWTEWA